MSYESTVYRILIASPSDVDEEREVAARVIQDWNDLNSFSKKIVLLPIRWETHSSPTYGNRPQEIINKQIVDDCDLLIGFFWTKVGSPTGEDLSGTIEEIKRVSKAGKPVMLYFSKRGKDPSQINLTQLEALNRFREDIYKVALVEHFNSIVEFRDKISRQLEMKIRELQERKESIKEIIAFSFINRETELLFSTHEKISIERVEFDNTRIQNIAKKDKRVSEKRSWLFENALHSYVNSKNVIPVLLGLQNNTGRIFGNVIVELAINSSIGGDELIIQNMSAERGGIHRRSYNSDLPLETELQIRRLFKDTLTKTSSNVWEFSSQQFSLLPNKIKVLETVLLLYPKTSMNVKFKINLFSENILQQIELHCQMDIEVTKRQITKEELEEIIRTLPDSFDDLPF